jgi:hypothetical protein
VVPFFLFLTMNVKQNDTDRRSAKVFIEALYKIRTNTGEAAAD